MPEAAWREGNRSSRGRIPLRRHFGLFLATTSASGAVHSRLGATMWAGSHGLPIVAGISHPPRRVGVPFAVQLRPNNSCRNSVTPHGVRRLSRAFTLVELLVVI